MPPADANSVDPGQTPSLEPGSSLFAGVDLSENVRTFWYLMFDDRLSLLFIDDNIAKVKVTSWSSWWSFDSEPVGRKMTHL